MFVHAKWPIEASSQSEDEADKWSEGGEKTFQHLLKEESESRRLMRRQNAVAMKASRTYSDAVLPGIFRDAETTCTFRQFLNVRLFGC